jgi:hypothetical protein
MTGGPHANLARSTVQRGESHAHHVAKLRVEALHLRKRIGVVQRHEALRRVEGDAPPIERPSADVQRARQWRVTAAVGRGVAHHEFPEGKNPASPLLTVVGAV